MAPIEAIVGAAVALLGVLAILFRNARRTDGDESPEPNPTPTPDPDPPDDPTPSPDEPEPDDPDPEQPDPECDEADVTAPDDAPTIEVHVFWNEGREQAATVVAAWTEYALAWGWGDQHHVDVRAMYAVPDDIDSPNDWAGYRKREIPTEEQAKDCNLLVGGRLGGQGGGRSAAASTPRSFEGLDPGCVRARHDHERLNAAIHEIGHCLGLEHEHGGRRSGAITPMQTTYQLGSSWTVHWHEDALAADLDIQ